MTVFKIRFEFTMESPEGTIFSYGGLKLFSERGRLKLYIKNKSYDLKKERGYFTNKVCDDKRHSVVARLCYSKNCNKVLQSVSKLITIERLVWS